MKIKFELNYLNLAFIDVLPFSDRHTIEGESQEFCEPTRILHGRRAFH